MSKVEKIRKEIERLEKSLPWGSCASQLSMECNCKNEAYNEVLSYIDSLKEPAKITPAEIEAAMQEIEEKSKLFTEAHKDDVVSNGPISNPLEISRHGNSHIGETLEKAATKYARKQLSNPDYPTYNDEYEMECAFEAGAQWQKERDQSTIELAEDHAILAGMEKMKQEMMKNVVLETKVMKDNDGDGIDTPYEEWLTLEDTEIPFIPDDIGLKDGDKVKLIIIREE